ncbi:hypothetical protein PHET_11920 [Paragonimus heterotremus]|uniref:Uncharacterized protein n=1 Tax=Paragonimus heterotremus TaxID=100268 RepID=A0A8J4WDD7_9TREM|nr:hypothetical protein PHET_11920 [Paragonimus heterotremus]
MSIAEDLEILCVEIRNSQKLLLKQQGRPRMASGGTAFSVNS